MDLTRGRPSKVIALYALPIIVGNFFQQVYAMVDSAVVGRFVGYEALAGVGATNGLTFLIFGFSTGITSGLGIRIAQCFGAKDSVGLRHSVAVSLLISACLAAALSFLPLAASGLLAWMNTPADIFLHSKRYLGTVLLGSAAQVAYNMAACLLRAIGDSRTPLLFLVFSSLLNVALDFLFIGAFGWGVAGAAWATVISQAVSAILSFVYAFNRYGCIRLTSADFRAADRSLAWDHLRLGLPMALQISITGIGLIMLQVALNAFPTTYIAGFTAANKVQNVGALVAIALGVAMANYAGQNFGAGNMDRIREGVRSSLRMALTVSVVCGACMVLFAHQLTSVFVKGEGVPQIFEASRAYLLSSAVFFPSLYALFIYRNALQGIGKPLWPLLGGVLELIVRVAVSFTLPRALGYNGIVLVDPLAWTSAFLLLAVAYHRNFRN